jgi:adenylate cyclase
MYNWSVLWIVLAQPQEEKVASLCIHLLGPIRVTLAGEPVSGFESDKARALLALLATEPQRPQRREALAGMLWPGNPDRAARTNLRGTLANLRRVLGDDAQSDPPLFHITRQTIQFNASADAWADVPRFLRRLQADRPAHRPPITHVAEAVDLYRGSFLQGFSIGDSPEFEEWALLTRERLHRLALDALHRLAHHYLQRGDYERALPYAWRQVELDPWREEAHRQVMRLLALTGRRGAALTQFETCRRLLDSELGVEPAVETVELYTQIRDGTLEPPRPPLPPSELQAVLPAFLEQEATEGSRPKFVARERELAQLDAFLEAALAGQGRAIFVTGEAGSGKTALLAAFARRAMDAHPHLLVATGNCNVLSGVGDPYLPFREVLAMLTGDVEARWAAGAISRAHARRLWTALPRAAQALVERGPHVTGTLLDGPALLSRAAAAAALDAHWLQRLRDRIERQRARPERVEQSFLFEQVTNTLAHLASSHPLLLILDDLQWADTASAGLLFHLGRRLAGCRILVASAYRPEELALGSDPDDGGERRTLQKALAEFKRQSGDVWVDLDRVDEAERRAFVAALLDTEPNCLRGEFRGALLQRTAGHPLFVRELLRDMRERGDLLQDADGRWIEGSRLDWEALPPRVEGAIQERIGRLAPDLRELLAVASVEGEEFSAQVVARVQGVEERQVLHALSHALGRQHHLVRASEEIRMGHQPLSRYRFAHVLFRDYLYHGLDPGERRLLHLEVGTALEALYQERIGDVAALLATHFAGHPEKEQHYARLAGERAAAQYANDEALRQLSRALALTPEGDREERFVLLLAREQVYDRQSNRDAQRRDLSALEEVAKALADPQKRAEVALRQAWHAWQRSDFPGAIRFATEAAGLGHSVVDPEIEAQAHRLWAIAISAMGDQGAALRHFEQAQTLARTAGARWLEAEILRQASWRHMMLGNYHRAETSLEESLRIFREIGDRHDEMRLQLSFAGLCQQQFNYGRALEHSDEVVRLSHELGSPLHGISALDYAARSYRECGDYERAKSCLEQILTGSREVGIRTWMGYAILHLAYVAHALGDSEQVLPSVQQALDLAQETGDRGLTADAMSHLGHYLEAFGQGEEAVATYEESMTLRREMGLVNATVEPQAGLARVCLAGGELDPAMGYVEDILSHLESGTLEGTEQPLLVYLTCYRVLQASDDPRAHQILDEGHRLLQEIAGKITDPELRRSFLENVAWHRELAQEYEQVRGEH